jgi:hypothetical protein
MASLGFSVSVPSSAPHDDESSIGGEIEPSTQSAVSPLYSGVWLSRYEYESSSRGATLTGSHYVVVIQQGDRLTVRSLPGAGSELTMDLTVDGVVVTGTWVEQTAAESYYRGARYHGAIQLLVEPTGHRMKGKWVGFGSDLTMNTGPWELVLEDRSTGKATLAAYSRSPA